MRILFGSDLHGNIPLYEELWRLAKEEEAGAIILGGDLFLLPSLSIEESRNKSSLPVPTSSQPSGLSDQRHPEKPFFSSMGIRTG